MVVITTTVDQAAQCHKRKLTDSRQSVELTVSVVRSIGGPLGIRSALATGVAGSTGLPSEIVGMQRDAIQILIGTPAKINDVLTSRGALGGSEVRLLIVGHYFRITCAQTLTMHSLTRSISSS